MSYMIKTLDEIFPKEDSDFGGKDWGEFIKRLNDAGYDMSITKKEREEFETEMLCKNCNDITEHLVHGSFHERDSSGELYTCLTCYWWASGYDGGREYNPPVDN